jgi:hypothetical protein
MLLNLEDPEIIAESNKFHEKLTITSLSERLKGKRFRKIKRQLIFNKTFLIRRHILITFGSTIAFFNIGFPSTIYFVHTLGPPHWLSWQSDRLVISRSHIKIMEEAFF